MTKEMKYPKIVIAALLLLALLTAISLYAATVKCPVDNSPAYFTGKTKSDPSGKLLWLYHCNSYGHEFWVVQ